MGFIWTTQLEKGVNNASEITTGPVSIRLSLMARSPQFTQDSGQIDAFKSITTMADLLSRPGWEEVSVSGYQRQLNTNCTLLTSGANTLVVPGQQSTTWTLGADTPVEALVMAVPGNFLGVPPAVYDEWAVGVGTAYEPVIRTSTVTNSPRTEGVVGTAVAYDALCRCEDEYVVFAADTPFRQQTRTVFRNGDGISALVDSLSNNRWFFGWATSGGEITGVAEGTTALQVGSPRFESARLQHVWLFPQRINYAANPSFEYSSGYWQSNKGALTQVSEESGYPSNKAGFVTGSTAVSPVPQYDPTERLYIRSGKFFPNDGTITFQLMAKGRGVVRVGLATYSNDYMEYAADWGEKDDLFFQEWDLAPDRYVKMQGIRTVPDTGYEAALLVEVRGSLADEDPAAPARSASATGTAYGPVIRTSTVTNSPKTEEVLAVGAALDAVCQIVSEYPDLTTYQFPYVTIDQCVIEEGALMEWPYFDGDTTYAAPDDYSWYGPPGSDRAGKSYSLWYNNRRDVNGRLFARRVDDTSLYTSKDEQLDSMLSEWVPAGVTVVPHWGAMSVDDTLLLPRDNSTSTLPVDLWPEKSQIFRIFEIVSATPTSITLKVIGEGGHPISSAYVKSGSAIYPATIGTRPWEQSGLLASEIDALKAELYDLTVAQTVTITWPPVPAFNSNTLYIERGDRLSPQSFIVYQLLSAAGSGFGTAIGEGLDATVASSVRLSTLSSTATAYDATTAYGALAQSANSTGTVQDAFTAVLYAAEVAGSNGTSFDGLVQYGVRPDAGSAAATGSASDTANDKVDAYAFTGADGFGAAFDTTNDKVDITASTVGIGSGAANNASIVKDDAPNPAFSLSGSYQTSGSTSWNAVANWSLPGDTDIASVKIRWTIGGTVGSWITLTSTATTYTQAATSGVTHTFEVQTVDNAGLVSTTTPSFALGSSPLDAVPSLTVVQVGLDGITATWSHPSGNNRSGYSVTITDGVTPSTTTEASSTTSKTWTLATNTAFTVTVTPLDDATGSNRSGRSTAGSATTTAPAPHWFALNSWTYSSVLLEWAGVPLAATYEVEQAVGNGAYTVVATGLTATQYNRTGLSQDTQYRFRVRAKGVSNYGTYSFEIRPAIGHPASSYTQAWSASNNSVNLYLNNPQGVYVPANVTTTYMGVNLTCTFATGLFSGSGTRTANYVAADAVGFGVGTQSNPWNVPLIAFAVNTPGLCGIQVFGSGWSSSPTGGFRATGTISVIGDETIYVSEVYNSYW